MKVELYIKTAPFVEEMAIRFSQDVAVDGDTVRIYLTEEKANLAIYMIASLLGEEITINGQTVEFVL